MLWKLLELKNMNLLVLIISAICFLSSILTSVILDQDPCILCLITRFAFLLVAIAASISIKYQSSYMMYTVYAITGLLLLISFYHLGVENHWWASPETCKVPLPTLESLMSQKELSKTTKCDDITLTIFGVSMTLLSFLVSAFIFWFMSLSVILKAYANR